MTKLEPGAIDVEESYYVFVYPDRPPLGYYEGMIIRQWNELALPGYEIGMDGGKLCIPKEHYKEFEACIPLINDLITGWDVAIDNALNLGTIDKFLDDYKNQYEAMLNSETVIEKLTAFIKFLDSHNVSGFEDDPMFLAVENKFIMRKAI